MKATLRFETAANAAVVSDRSKALLAELAGAAGLREIFISSTQRDAHAQARAMFHNCEATGPSQQLKLYRAPGQQVVRAYIVGKAHKLSPAGVMAAMEKKIIEVGASNVSRHCADPAKLNVVDVRPMRMPSAQRVAFIAEVEKAVADGRVSKFLKPPADPAFHIEIPQEGAA